MKKQALFPLTLIFSASVFAQTETITRANELINDRQYASAFKLLQDADPKNYNPEMVLLKENIALKYFVTTRMHQMFAFKDLTAKEEIKDYRGKNGAYTLYVFDPEEILNNLIGLYPENCALYKGLGDFYYEVQLYYDTTWLKKKDELFDLIETNYTKANEKKCGDFMTYYVLGYINAAKSKYEESVPYFLESIRLNKNYPFSQYQLAYSYFYLDDRETAILYLQNALNLFNDKANKGMVARLMGKIYMEFGEDTSAIENFELANKIEPGMYFNLKPLLFEYVKTKNPKAEETLYAFFKTDPGNPDIYNELEDIYSSHKNSDDLKTFYLSQIPVYKDNQQVSGNLYFYLARMYMAIDKKATKEYLLKAKDIFSRIYVPDHPVFQAIEVGLGETEK